MVYSCNDFLCLAKFAYLKLLNNLVMRTLFGYYVLFRSDKIAD